MQLINSIDVYTPSGIRSFELWNGDVTSVGFAVDLLIISSVGQQFSPFSNTVIGALSRTLKVSVEDLSKHPDLEFCQSSGRLWVSKLVLPKRIRRIMCVEIPYQTKNSANAVKQAFRLLPVLEANEIPLRTICLPVLGAGLHGLTVGSVLPSILDGSQGASSS
jgi:hypothetical protein